MFRVDTSEPVEIRREPVEEFSGSADSTRDSTSTPHLRVDNIATETIKEEEEGRDSRRKGDMCTRNRAKVEVLHLTCHQHP